MVNAKRKGKNGELDFVNFLKRYDVKACRGVQYKGAKDSPDVITDLKDLHFEVKRTNRLSLYKALEQAIKDAEDKIPVVAHRQNRREWTVILRASDFLELIRGIPPGLKDLLE